MVDGNKWSVELQTFPYKLKGLGIVGSLGLTVVSPDYMKFPGVVKWCSDRGAIPVSPRECLMNRFAQNGLNDTDKTQFTRGVILNTVIDGKIVALPDDVANPDDNVALKYFGLGVADHGFGNFVLPRNNSVVKNAIDRAIADNRVISLEGRTVNYTTHSLTSDSDGCDYERVLTPIVGREVALGNVEFLRGRKEHYSSGGIWLSTPEDLKSLNLNDTVFVRLFRVGGVDSFYYYLKGVSADSSYNVNGRACGVASTNTKVELLNSSIRRQVIAEQTNPFIEVITASAKKSGSSLLSLDTILSVLNNRDISLSGDVKYQLELEYKRLCGDV